MFLKSLLVSLILIYIIDCEKSSRNKGRIDNRKLPINDFIPFGTNAGDKSFVKFKGCSRNELVENLKFYDFFYKSIWLCSGGIIAVDDSFDDFYLGYPKSFPVLNKKIIAPFWDDIDMTLGGEIFYRQTLNQSILEEIGSQINKMYLNNSTSFKPKSAFVATYFEVSEYRGSPKFKNTFQVILAYDANNTYTIFNYNSLNWINLNTISGVNSGDCINYFIMEPYLNEYSSNVGIAGKWIIHVSHKKPGNFNCKTTTTSTKSSTKTLTKSSTKTSTRTFEEISINQKNENFKLYMLFIAALILVLIIMILLFLLVRNKFISLNKKAEEYIQQIELQRRY